MAARVYIGFYRLYKNNALFTDTHMTEQTSMSDCLAKVHYYYKPLHIAVT